MDLLLGLRTPDIRPRGDPDLSVAAQANRRHPKGDGHTYENKAAANSSGLKGWRSSDDSPTPT